MERGHPYATTELDGLRAEQRRVLRTLPEQFVTQHLEVPDLPVPDNPIDRFMVESMLREQAQELFKSGPVDFINRMREHTEWGALAAYLAAGKSVPAFPLSGAVEWLGHEARTVQGDTPPDPDRHADWLKRLLVALLLADRLAEDGYLDPRIP